MNTDILNDILLAAQQYPDNNAFIIEGKAYTYQKLFSRVKGIIPLISESEDIIGVVAENRIETYASILAILFSGKTYVMLHPHYPDYRNKQIADTTAMKQILYCEQSIVSDLMPNYIEYLCTREVSIPYERELSVKGESDSFAYIIFTSGSTGKPKGVPISRGNLNAFYNAYSNLGWELGPNDRMLQLFELTFDISVVSILHPLTLGACIYTVDSKGLKYMKVFELLEEENLTFATVPPSLLQFLSPYFEEIYLPLLKYLIVSAEASQVDLLQRFMKCAPNASFYNLYGPTEATIYCTAYRIPEKNCKQYNGMIAIGKPFTNMEALIISETHQQIACEEKGELCISGPQVMQNYWRNKEKSESVFIRNRQGKVFYKTGDLCYIDKEGDIIYCGRKDSQIKVQGFRVELSEIEYTAQRFYKNETNVVVIPQYGEENGCKLHLFIEREQCDKEALFYHLKMHLPLYMLPEEIHCIKEFPLNTSNKTDRKKLLSFI